MMVFKITTSSSPHPQLDIETRYINNQNRDPYSHRIYILAVTMKMEEKEMIEETFCKQKQQDFHIH